MTVAQRLTILTMKEIIVVLLFGVHCGGRSEAAKPPKKDETNTVTVWVSEVQAAGVEDKWEELGEFPTLQEAADCSAKWSKDHPDSVRLTREREIQVRKTTPRPGTKAEEPQVPKIGAKLGEGIEKAKKWITVTVYKEEDGKWIKQPDKTYNTESDYETASAYYQKWRTTPGWRACWNARGFDKPPVSRVDEK
jgi:hypothetical protein